MPRDRFLVAGDAWRLCRDGDADPASFGLSSLNEAGYWWIAGNLLRDVAALNNMEMLPWDVWGAMPAPDEAISDEQYALFDRLAGLTRDPRRRDRRPDRRLRRRRPPARSRHRLQRGPEPPRAGARVRAVTYLRQAGFGCYNVAVRATEGGGS